MKLSNTPTIALFAVACGFFSDFAHALTRQRALNFRNARSLAAPPGDVTTTAAMVLNATFEQLIDHDNPSLGTFSQFYYYSTEFYKGPGSPVVSSSKIGWPMAVVRRRADIKYTNQSLCRSSSHRERVLFSLTQRKWHLPACRPLLNVYLQLRNHSQNHGRHCAGAWCRRHRH
jgi:hypothetical protein